MLISFSQDRPRRLLLRLSTGDDPSAPAPPVRRVRPSSPPGQDAGAQGDGIHDGNKGINAVFWTKIFWSCLLKIFQSFFVGWTALQVRLVGQPAEGPAEARHAPVREETEDGRQR